MPAGAGLVHQSDRGESLDKPVGVYAPVAPATVRRITERVMNVLNADAKRWLRLSEQVDAPG